ncbi:transmembrane protein 54 [Spea bombifrons]|uniref:transmembrane protein 54 n=1 Tax=Spea bombifrons TaxID=233779 RepID=UPI00234941CD|nr:transmembrane protein 54 [Spea bombifrons]
MCGPRTLEAPPFGKILMKQGLGLIVVGHLNFIVGAIVHGLVLRHVARLQDTASVQYSVANITAVVSAILSISCGIVAIVLSRYLKHRSLRWAAVVLSIINALLSAACTIGIAISIIITVVNQGSTLLSSCTFADLELIQISYECPFDPTRIYSTTLCLWVLSILLDITEVVFSCQCFFTVLHLMDIYLCHKRRRRRKVKLQFAQVANDMESENEGLNPEESCSVWL